MAIAVQIRSFHFRPVALRVLVRGRLQGFPPRRSPSADLQQVMAGSLQCSLELFRRHPVAAVDDAGTACGEH